MIPSCRYFNKKDEKKLKSKSPATIIEYYSKIPPGRYSERYAFGWRWCAGCNVWYNPEEVKELNGVCRECHHRTRFNVRKEKHRKKKKE